MDVVDRPVLVCVYERVLVFHVCAKASTLCMRNACEKASSLVNTSEDGGKSGGRLQGLNPILHTAPHTAHTHTLAPPPSTPPTHEDWSKPGCRMWASRGLECRVRPSLAVP